MPALPVPKSPTRNNQRFRIEPRNRSRHVSPGVVREGHREDGSRVPRGTFFHQNPSKTHSPHLHKDLRRMTPSGFTGGGWIQGRLGLQLRPEPVEKGISPSKKRHTECRAIVHPWINLLHLSKRRTSTFAWIVKNLVKQRQFHTRMSNTQQNVGSLFQCKKVNLTRVDTVMCWLCVSTAIGPSCCPRGGWIQGRMGDSPHLNPDEMPLPLPQLSSVGVIRWLFCISTCFALFYGPY